MRPRGPSVRVVAGAGFALVLAAGALTSRVTTQSQLSVGSQVKGQPIEQLVSSSGLAALRARFRLIAPLLKPADPIETDLIISPGPGAGGPGDSGGNEEGGGGGGGNRFVNDPCLDPAPTAPFPENFRRTVQSETEIAVLNSVGGDDDDSDDDDADDNGDDDGRGSGKLMVAGYNDSFGFYDNRQGISGFSYSINGGKQWIDGGGLPPLVPSGAPAGTLGSDAYFGDPVVVVHHQTKTFYYASLYLNPAGALTVSVNRGQFRVAPQQVPVESYANTRCEGNPAAHGLPDPPPLVQTRIIWEPPVEAAVPVLGGDGVPGTDDDDFLDKPWLYVNQETGFLYLTYTRFTPEGETPIEMVRSFDGGQTWTPPSIIVPNLLDTFNQATQPVVTPTGRVIVTWLARTFPLPALVEREQRIEVAFSDDGGSTFGPPVVVARVNPQRMPIGYNRTSILNAPSITVDKGRDDGMITNGERNTPGFGNVYITYFNGLTPFAEPPNPNPVFARAADIHLSTSNTDGATWGSEVEVNDDPGDTSHVFPSVQVNKHGEVFVTWIDRRNDRPRNLLNDTWGDVSNHLGQLTGTDFRITTVSTDWITREDAAPDYGDYNSSEVINFNMFCSIWADGRFPAPAPITSPTPPFTRPANQAATPDSLFACVGRAKGKKED